VTPATSPPEGMTLAHWAKVCRLRDEARCRTLERAALCQEATGCSWPVADAAAWEQEAVAQRDLFGGAT
jgi:hypothetical protein